MSRILLCESSSELSSDEENIEIIVENGGNRRIEKRKIRQRINFDFLLSSFKERFRVSPSTAETILNKIGLIISHKTKKNHALDARQQLLVALHFFGCGSQYHCVGDMHGVHASTVCRIINRVTKTVNETMFTSEVCWPNNILSVPLGFSHIAGFSRVAGKY